MCRSPLPNIKALRPNVQLREGSIKYEKLLCEIEHLRKQAVFELRIRQEEADTEYQRQIQEQLEQDEKFARRLHEQFNNEGNEDEILQPSRKKEPLFDLEDANLADPFQEQLNNIVERIPPRNQAINQLKNCRHTCQLSAGIPHCCWCSDRRPISNGYKRYVDGEGWRNDAKRDQYYCMECFGKNDREK